MVFTELINNYVSIICKNISSSRSSIGRAELWRCLGCKFKSYLGQFIKLNISLKVMMELVDMNSLGLFDF